MTKLDTWRDAQHDLRAASDQRNQFYYQEAIGRAIVTQGLSSPWSARVNHALMETWNEEFLHLWEKTLHRLRVTVEQTKEEARAEAKDVIEETEPMAYG